MRKSKTVLFPAIVITLALLSFSCLPVLADCLSDQLACTNNCILNNMSDYNCVSNCGERATACIQRQYNGSTKESGAGRPDSGSNDADIPPSRSNGQQGTRAYSASASHANDGCYDAPNYCLKVENTRWNKDNFLVRYRNVCQDRLYIRSCNKKKNGSWDCGVSGILGGGTFSFDTYNATGEYSYKAVGSSKWQNDWICTDKVPGWNSNP